MGVVLYHCVFLLIFNHQLITYFVVHTCVCMTGGACVSKQISRKFRNVVLKKVRNLEDKDVSPLSRRCLVLNVAQTLDDVVVRTLGQFIPTVGFEHLLSRL